METDPEAGMFSAYMKGCNPRNLEKMRSFETHVRTMLADEKKLMKFIQKHREEIEWD